MRLTRQQLRGLIRKTLVEYDRIERGERRKLGQLTPKEREHEKGVLRDYHTTHKDEVFKFYNEIKKFPNGEITILHAIQYPGEAYDLNPGTPLPSDWVELYGKQGRDQLSTVAIPNDPQHLFERYSALFQQD